MHASHASRSAFSLVELSIVLVILGLLTGGILAGQSLIRASELRSITTDFQRYTTALGGFRDKYFGVPGDLNNGTSFGWTGNGDGDGAIELSTTATSNENSTAWIHLASAGLVEGNYTNVAATSASVCGTMTAGTNNPRARLANAGWNMLSLGTVTASSVIYYAGSYGNALLLGGGTTCGTATPQTGILKAEEAWNIDTKTDDARPNTGVVTTYESQGAATPNGCGNAAAHASDTGVTASQYDLANTSGTACALVFKSGY